MGYSGGNQTIKRQTRAAYGCLIAGQNQWAWVWTATYRLFIHPSCLWHRSATAAAACGLWRYIRVICREGIPILIPYPLRNLWEFPRNSHIPAILPTFTAKCKFTSGKFIYSSFDGSSAEMRRYQCSISVRTGVNGHPAPIIQWSLGAYLWWRPKEQCNLSDPCREWVLILRDVLLSGCLVGQLDHMVGLLVCAYAQIPLGSSRHVSTRHHTFDILAASCLSNSTARHARLDPLDMSNVSCRAET